MKYTMNIFLVHDDQFLVVLVEQFLIHCKKYFTNIYFVEHFDNIHKKGERKNKE